MFYMCKAIMITNQSPEGFTIIIATYLVNGVNVDKSETRTVIS